MDEKQIEQKLTEVLVGQFEIEKDLIHPGARFREDLGIDSIDAVDMIVYLEKDLGKRLNLIDLMKIRTVQNLVDLIKQNLPPA